MAGASQVGLVVKNAPASAGDVIDEGLILGLKVPRRRARQPTPVFLPGESHGQRSLVGYNPRGHKESDTTEPLHFTSLHFNQLPYSGKPSWLFLSFIFSDFSV